LSNVCKFHNVDFVYAHQIGKDNLKKIAEQTRSKINKRLYRPEASVVFIGEIYENTNAKDIVLILANHFSKSGYKTSVVMESGFSQIMGFHGTDELFGNETINAIDNITAINEYFEGLEKLEQPDIILVQILGGMMKYSDIVHNSYGIYPYMLSQAIEPDYFVCCLPFGEYDSDELQLYSDLFSSRFGYSIDYTHLSNLLIDASNLTETFKLEQTFLPYERINMFIVANMSDSEIPIINALDYHGQQMLCKKVEEILLSYNDATAI
jgi:peptide maturation system protein (TIGR04066 family)